MGDTYSVVEIRSTLRTFQEYLRDLMEAKFDVFQTKLRLFINFCEKDDAFRVLARHFHTDVGDVREWFTASAAGGAMRELPRDAVARLAHQYKTLLELKQQRIDLRNLLSTVFTGHTIGDAHKRFVAEWLAPMRASFQRLFERMEGELVGKEREDLEVLVEASLAKLGDASPAPASAPAPSAPRAPAAPPAAAGASPGAKKGADLALPDLVKLLDKAVKGAKDLAAGVKDDVQANLKMLKLELGKSAPNLDVVRMIAEPLERTGGKIAEVAAAIASKAKRGKS